MDLPGPKVMAERTVVSADADLRVSRLPPPSPLIQQHRLVRAKSAPSPCRALTPAAQQPEPPYQAPLFPCDAAGAVLPLFHPSTATSSSPRSRPTTTASIMPAAGSGASVPAVAIGDCDEAEGEEEDSVESVIEWIDEMLSGCGVVGEGFGGREKRRRGGTGRDAREVLEWLEELKFEA